MKLSDKPIANTTVVLREEFDKWAVLFNPDTSGAVGISSVGVEVWKLLDGKRSIAEIVDVIEDRFAEVPETVAQEITKFADDLAELGFAACELEGADS